jgi:hypothetical protein
MGSSPISGTNQITWSANLAYALGLLATDGNLSGDGRHMSLVSKDRIQILQFRSILGLRNKIGYTRNKRSTCYRVQFGNVIFYRWLVRQGFTPAKSLTLGAIKIPDKFFLPFLRGCLDGDGSIANYIDRYNQNKSKSYIYQRLYLRFYSASALHIDWLDKTIVKLTGISGYIATQKRKNKLYVLGFSKKKADSLLDLIYASPGFFLPRKKKIYTLFLKKKIYWKKRKTLKLLRKRQKRWLGVHTNPSSSKRTVVGVSQNNTIAFKKPGSSMTYRCSIKQWQDWLHP